MTIPYVSAYDECPHVQYDETAAGTFRGSEAAEAQAKRLDLLNKLVTAAASIGVLANPKFRDTDRQLHELQDAAVGLKRRLQILRASNSDEIDAAFAAAADERVAGLLVVSDLFLPDNATSLWRWQLVSRM